MKVKFESGYAKGIMLSGAMQSLVRSTLEGVAGRAGPGHYAVHVDTNGPGDRYRGAVVTADAEAMRKTQKYGNLLSALGGGTM